MSVWRSVPGLQAAAAYQRGWAPRDVMAGVVLSTLLVPQGMAYAELAGLPPITGLYTSITCPLAYAAFGPSRILVLGPDSSLGPIIAAASAFDLAAHGVSLVGELPRGFPPLTLPDVRWEARPVPGLVVYRFAAPLIFANAKRFRDRLTRLARRPGTRWIVVAAESVTDVDVTACDMLVKLREDLRSRGIEMMFAELQDPVWQKTEHCDPAAAPANHRFSSVHAAEDAFRARTPDDRTPGGGG